LIAGASGIAVNTTMGTASIKIHTISGGQDPFNKLFVDKVHLLQPFSVLV